MRRENTKLIEFHLKEGYSTRIEVDNDKVEKVMSDINETILSANPFQFEEKIINCEEVVYVEILED